MVNGATNEGGVNASFGFQESVDFPGAYHITLTNSTDDNVRLHLDADGTVTMQATSFVGEQSSFYMTDAIFTPDPLLPYQILSAEGYMLAATGVGTNTPPYTVLEEDIATVPAEDLEWEFEEHANGLWHIQLASGETVSRLRHDGSDEADMQPETSSGGWTQYEITPIATDPDFYQIEATESGHDDTILSIDVDLVKHIVEDTSVLAAKVQIESIAEEVPPTTDDEITIVSPVAYQVIQRDEAGEADISIQGFTTVGALEAQWNDSGLWTALTTDANGEVSGTLPAQAQGQGTLIIRSLDETFSIEVEFIGVGDLFVIAGQSNASARGFENSTYTHPSLKAGLFGNDYTWKELTDPVDDNTGQIDAVSNDGQAQKGSSYPLIATTILANQGVPIAFIPCPKGGTSISDWQPSADDRSDVSTLYGSMYTRMQAVGGRVKGVLFYLGETNSVNNTSQVDFETGLNDFVDAVALDFPDLKVMVTGIGSFEPIGTNDEVKRAQDMVILINDNALRGPITYDVNLEDEGADFLHFKSVNDLTELGRRWALTIEKGFYGETYGYGPIVDELNIAYDETTNTITVPFVVEDTETLSPASTVTSSAFILTNGSEIAISDVSIDENNVLLTLGEVLDVTVPITLTYGAQNSGIENAIYDTNELPAPTFYDVAIAIGDTEVISPEMQALRTLYENPDGKVMLAAHRGYWRNVPENSLVSFERAIAMEGIYMVEIDVKLTSDGHIILFHDSELGRIGTVPSHLESKSRNVTELTLCDIRPSLDTCPTSTNEDVRLLDSTGNEYLREDGTYEVLPTLEETFDLLQYGGEYNTFRPVFINIDKIGLGDGSEEKPITYIFDQIYDMAKSRNMLNQIVVKQGLGKVKIEELRASEVVDWSKWYYTPSFFPDASCATSGLTFTECLKEYVEDTGAGFVDNTDSFNVPGAEFIYLEDGDLSDISIYMRDNGIRLIQFPQYPENLEGNFSAADERYADVDPRVDRRGDWRWLLEEDGRRPDFIISDRLEVLRELLKSLDLLSTPEE